MSLADAYLSIRPDAGANELEARLERLCRAVEHALPEVPLDRVRFVMALAALPRDAGAVSDEDARELALALGCDAGHSAALRIVEREYLARVPRALASMKLTRDIVDEVVQEVRTKLLVADGGPARIVGYAGRGTLHGLLKVVATRAAISLLRKVGRESPSDEGVLDVVGERDPELAFLQERYRSAFREAFEDAVAGLEPRERNLLRLHFLRKVTLEALATMYGVHRATIVRQLAQVREKLERATKKALRERLQLPSHELDAVLDVIRSHLDASVERLLRTMDG